MKVILEILNVSKKWVINRIYINNDDNWQLIKDSPRYI